MAKFSINQTTTMRWSFDEDLVHYQQAGIGGVHLWRRKLWDFGVEKAHYLLDELGLEVSALSWAGGFTGGDGRGYAESLRDAKKALFEAIDLRAKCVVVYSGSRGGHTLNHSRRLLQSAITEILPIAEEHGIPLAIKPMHHGYGTEWSIFRKLEEAIAFAEIFKSPYLKLVLDLYEFGRLPIDRIPWDGLVPHLALVQLGDSKAPPRDEPNRCRLGEGQLPLEKWVRRINDQGYQGYYDVELIGVDVENQPYEGLIEHSLDYFRALETRVNP